MFKKRSQTLPIVTNYVDANRLKHCCQFSIFFLDLPLCSARKVEKYPGKYLFSFSSAFEPEIVLIP